MALTDEQKRQRDGRLTASRVGCLMSGDETKIMNLWREMVGHADHEPEDLSWVWPVILGEATEALNLSWYEHCTGRSLTRGGEVVICPRADWAAATLDGWDDVEPGPIDAKHVGGWEPREKVVARYVPQMVWQMICTESEWSALSIIEGARQPVIEVVRWDAAYAYELWRRAEAFMECVETLTPPIALAPIEAPMPIVRVVDMAASNSFAEHAAAWLANKDAAAKFAKAVEEIKSHIEPDVAKVYGHGIEATKDARGAVRIKAKP